MLIMAERVNHPPHYNAGGIECIDALEAATSGLQGIAAAWDIDAEEVFGRADE